QRSFYPVLVRGSSHDQMLWHARSGGGVEQLDFGFFAPLGRPGQLLPILRFEVISPAGWRLAVYGEIEHGFKYGVGAYEDAIQIERKHAYRSYGVITDQFRLGAHAFASLFAYTLCDRECHHDAREQE